MMTEIIKPEVLNARAIDRRIVCFADATDRSLASKTKPPCREQRRSVK